MTEKLEEISIKEGNKLIAGFVGAEIFGQSWRLSKGTDLRQYLDHYPADMELPFNKDWNWLMPVVEKIKELPISEFPKKKPVMNALLDVDITVLHKAVVEFIQWCNTRELTA